MIAGQGISWPGAPEGEILTSFIKINWPKTVVVINSSKPPELNPTVPCSADYTHAKGWGVVVQKGVGVIKDILPKKTSGYPNLAWLVEKIEREQLGLVQ